MFAKPLFLFQDFDGDYIHWQMIGPDDITARDANIFWKSPDYAIGTIIAKEPSAPSKAIADH